MADIIYHSFFAEQSVGNVDFETDVLQVALLDSGYTPDADHTTWADASGNEIANGNGYLTGGYTVSGSVTNDDANDLVKYDITDPTWTASGGNIGPARYAVLFDDTHASDALVYLFDFGSEKTASDTKDFSITIDPNGLFTGQQA